METIEKSAKTVDIAIEQALATLLASRDEVDVEVIETGSKGFIGIGAKPAKVRVTVKYDPEKLAVSFLKDICTAMGVSVEIESNLKLEEKQLDISITGETIGILIGKRGQTLDSLQYLVSLAINRGKAPYINVLIDSEGYRQKRKEILENLAQNLAKKVRATKRLVSLEPMNTFERRIIHTTLQHDKTISTYSEGSDPFRNIVIAPKRFYNKDSRDNKDNKDNRDNKDRHAR